MMFNFVDVYMVDVDVDVVGISSVTAVFARTRFVVG